MEILRPPVDLISTWSICAWFALLNNNSTHHRNSQYPSSYVVSYTSSDACICPPHTIFLESFWNRNIEFSIRILFRLIGNFTCKKNVRKFLNGNFQNVEHAKGDDEKRCKINVWNKIERSLNNEIKVLSSFIYFSLIMTK